MTTYAWGWEMFRENTPQPEPTKRTKDWVKQAKEEELDPWEQITVIFDDLSGAWRDIQIVIDEIEERTQAPKRPGKLLERRWEEPVLAIFAEPP
jgi:hypothetical protein